MKIVYIECNAEEMKANRTLIDAITDAVNSMLDFNSPVSAEQAAGDLMGGNDTDQQSDLEKVI